MTTLGDFSSLLQLGVGTGIALSLFRAPVDIRANDMARLIENELVALRGVLTPFAKAKRRDMQDLKLRFFAAREDLERILMPFMVAAVIGAIANLIALILAALHDDQVLSCNWIYVMLFIAVGWFIIELVALEVLARRKLAALGRELRTLRQRRAPAIS